MSSGPLWGVFIYTLNFNKSWIITGIIGLPRSGTFNDFHIFIVLYFIERYNNSFYIRITEKRLLQTNDFDKFLIFLTLAEVLCKRIPSINVQIHNIGKNSLNKKSRHTYWFAKVSHNYLKTDRKWIENVTTSS